MKRGKIAAGAAMLLSAGLPVAYSPIYANILEQKARTYQALGPYLAMHVAAPLVFAGLGVAALLLWNKYLRKERGGALIAGLSFAWWTVLFLDGALRFAGLSLSIFRLDYAFAISDLAAMFGAAWLTALILALRDRRNRPAA